MSINYDHIKAGTAVINEFDKRLKALCEEYQQKLSDACPEDIHHCIGDVTTKSRRCIQLHYNTLEEALEDGFGNVSDTDDALHLSREVDGMKIVTVVGKKGSVPQEGR